MISRTYYWYFQHFYETKHVTAQNSWKEKKEEFSLKKISQSKCKKNLFSRIEYLVIELAHVYKNECEYRIFIKFDKILSLIKLK